MEIVELLVDVYFDFSTKNDIITREFYEFDFDYVDYDKMNDFLDKLFIFDNVKLNKIEENGISFELNGEPQFYYIQKAIKHKDKYYELKELKQIEIK